jgi:hypothetical protein
MLTVIKNNLEDLREYLRQRRYAYKRIFNLDDHDVQFILKDLAKFCRAHESTFNPDERTHALLEGRKEVFLRIQQHLNLTEEQLWSLYHKG